jgi:lysine-specific demethylase/histidyl-hydroxylase NO66
MDGRSHSLASLLQPVSPAAFFRDHWERKPLIVQGRSEGHYDALMRERDLEDIISRPDVRYPAIRLAKDGAYFPAETYTRNVEVGALTFPAVVDVERISTEYGQGATVALPALHRLWDPVRALCAELDQELSHSCHANAYITPGCARGFTPHYDTHEVLVLQLAGQKRWLIDEPTIDLPHDSQTFDPRHFKPGRRLMEIELHAGDFLYLPRGFVHSTTTSARHSAHVTIGINVYSWVDLVRDLLPDGVDDPELRKALPVGFADRAELRAEVIERLGRLLPGKPTGELHRRLDRLIAIIHGTRRRPPARFRTDLVVLSADSLLRPPTGLEYAMARSGEQVQLDFDGRRYVFPSQVGVVLDEMCALASFRVHDLCRDKPAEFLLSFARYLHGIGFLRPVPGEVPPVSYEVRLASIGGISADSIP